MVHVTARSYELIYARYLWGEVDRLKAQVQELQAAERVTQDTAQRMKEYVASFVTHAQLDAALCTKISQASVAALVDKLRGELHNTLEKKADVDAIQALQTKKLDISVYESSTWDLKKFRTALEQNVHDLFATFAHQIEVQVGSKLSIEDFNHIFNPESNGQKAAIENAATKIARMTDQIEGLKEYVNADKQRQHKIADLNVSLLDMTRKQNASRNAFAQLSSNMEASHAQLSLLEAKHTELTTLHNEFQTQFASLQEQCTANDAKLAVYLDKLTTNVDKAVCGNQQVLQELEKTKRYIQQQLCEPLATQMKQLGRTLQSEIDDGLIQHRKTQAQVNQQLHRLDERLRRSVQEGEELGHRLHRLESSLAHVSSELTEVKGPLVTMATNLREENVAILDEIHRSQHESREIMLDYRELLDREDPRHLPMRPPSSSSNSSGRFSAASWINRKQKHQLALTNAPSRGAHQRPHTTASPRKPLERPATTIGHTRAKTAGATPSMPAVQRGSIAGGSRRSLASISVDGGDPTFVFDTVAPLNTSSNQENEDAQPKAVELRSSASTSSDESLLMPTQ
ncbi:TPA: hypothetical protein N0F65_010763 [Lagenidium giganteum]|uniref:Uncharacterized protein n=1 Tax=Lagenidium giganteum TaxID=4803 RepID=A0AAV2YCN6_9STRA|nr:TPA: hypothetical protein N0F65_010763 [Lagenidium giganteum]